VLFRLALPLVLLPLPSIFAQAEHPLTGRHIAPVMGAAGADWLERHERAGEEQPDKALDLIGIQPGMTIADVGAGTGYMTLRIAKRVGPKGKVYANDIQPEMLERLGENARRANLDNIETVLGSESDAKLPEGRMDLIILVDVYHEFSRPQEMLRSMRRALKADGKLVLLEYKKEDPSIPIRPDHKMLTADAKIEVEAEGFELDKVIDVLRRQHIIMFRKVERVAALLAAPWSEQNPDSLELRGKRFQERL
jgi:ubiquinone/menaquinone biosynthesis C-methylase UbiE